MTPIPASYRLPQLVFDDPSQQEPGGRFLLGRTVFLEDLYALVP